MFFRSLRWKITRAFLAVVLVTMALLAVAWYQTLNTQTLSNLESRLASEALLVREIAQDQYPSAQPSPSLEALARQLDEQIGARVTLINAEGVVIADSEEAASGMANHLLRPEISQAASEGLGVARRFSATQSRETLYVAVPVQQEAQVVGYVRLALPLTHANQLTLQLWKTALLYIGLALLVIGYLTHRLGLMVTEPISEMIGWARRIARGKFQREVSGVSLQRPDEIGDLGQALDHMARRFNQLMQTVTESRDKLETVITNTSSGILLLDKEGRVDLYNPALCRMLGAESSMSKGLTVAAATRNFELSQFVQETLAAGEPRAKEMTVLTPTERIIQVLVVPVGGKESVYVGALVVIYDITELRRLERVRTDFVANASHELRTPVAAIKGFTETLLEGALKDEKTSREFLESIHSEADRLERIVSDLLQLAQTEARREMIRSESVDLAQAALDVIQKLKPQAQEARLTFDFEVPAHPVLILANHDYVQQILINLLSNAIAFTPPGGKVEVAFEEMEDRVQVAVKDTGIGIPEEELPRIFERFYLVDKSRSRKLGGTGLGLSIVRHMVEAMGGQVWAESQVGKGSTFYFTLPRYRY